MRITTSALLALLALTPVVAAAQAHDSTAVEQRAAQMVAMINGAAVRVDTMFAPAFLAQVPAANLTRAVSGLNAQLGTVDRISAATRGPSGATSAAFALTMHNGFVIPMTITVEATGLHLITGLLFGAPTNGAATLDDLIQQFAALPGHVSVLFARIDGDRIVPRAALDTNRALGLGSAFKLYILADLIREVEKGTRHWNDVVLLDSASRSLPSGVLHQWPAGTPMTVQSLATLMISQSDNTAADRLLHLLGRAQVEATQTVAGNTHADRNLPFLTTREMFALKTPADSALALRYRAGSVAERRNVLGQVDALPYDSLDPNFANGPVAIDSIEWFASANDLARTMLWIRDHTTQPTTAAGRGVLAVNPGIDWAPGTWAYVGFKGGSEPGVLDLTFLLRRPDGQWFVLTATWNNPASTVDETTLVGLMKRAGELLAAEH